MTVQAAIAHVLASGEAIPEHELYERVWPLLTKKMSAAAFGARFREWKRSVNESNADVRRVLKEKVPGKKYPRWRMVREDGAQMRLVG